MSVSLTVNGVAFAYPQTGDENWGDAAQGWASAVTTGMLQKAGGTFTLTADVDFGASFGLKSTYYKSRAANPSSAGQVRLGNTEGVYWRNAGNSADLALTVNASNRLQWESVNVLNASSVDTVTNKTLDNTNTITLKDTLFTLQDDGDTTKQAKFQLSGITTATTRTYTLPDATTTVVGTDATQSISNKTFNSTNIFTMGDGSFFIADNADATKIAQFQAGGISTGTTRTFTFPDANTTLVGTDATQTFTNKTFDAEGTGNSLSNVKNSNIKAAAGIVYSKLDLTGGIVNADISGSAAIAYSKLNLSASIVDADVSGSAAIAYSKLNLSGSIVNADVSASAAIAFSKLAALSSGNILVGNGSNVAASVAVTGDVTISNAGVTAIGTNKVLNSMLNQMAQSTFKGRASGAGTGDPVDLTATQATAILNNMVGDSGSGGTKGLVPAPASGDAAAGKFLKADGTWTAPSGAGDVVGPASSTDNAVVRFDSTTGKLIQDSSATVDDSGNVSGTSFKAGNGSANSPSFSFTSDDDGSGTGIYRVGTNSLGFSAGGTSVANYASTGLWTLGPSTAAVNHITQGGMRFGGQSATASNSPIVSGAGSGSLGGAGTTYDIANANFSGPVIIINNNNQFAMFFLKGGTSTYELLDPENVFSATKDNGGTMNVYWDSGASKFRVQNNSGNTYTFTFFAIASVAASSTDSKLL